MIKEIFHQYMCIFGIQFVGKYVRVSSLSGQYKIVTVFEINDILKKSFSTRIWFSNFKYCASAITLFLLIIYFFFFLLHCNVLLCTARN
jgi:hypothetical protein